LLLPLLLLHGRFPITFRIQPDRHRPFLPPAACSRGNKLFIYLFSHGLCRNKGLLHFFAEQQVFE
jgi:hypothetical protein